MIDKADQSKSRLFLLEAGTLKIDSSSKTSDDESRHAPISFKPSAEFWSDMDNFEAIPDNSLYNLNCEYAPKAADMQKLFACVQRQSQSIHDLYLAGLKLGNSELAMLGKFERLNTICLIDSGTDGLALSKLPHLCNYRCVDFSDGKNAEAIIRVVVNSQTISQLWLRNDHLNGADIAKISTIPNLRRLDVGNNRDITDKDLKPLLKLTKLNELKVDGCKISPGAIATFEALKKSGLATLSLSRLGWSDDDSEKIRKLFPDGDFKDDKANKTKSDTVTEFDDLFKPATK